MTKRIVSLLACTILISILTACSTTTDNTPSDTMSDSTGSTQITPDTAEGMEASTSGTTTRVLWTISDYVLGKDFSGDENSAKEFLFKPLDINDTQIIFDGQVCDSVSFEKTSLNTSDYLASNWQETSQSLGIDFKELEVIKTNCNLFGFHEYMRLGNGQLIVPYNGAFFFFAPAVN
ncbi:MAG: hypothetical protein AB2L18_09425 [Anaerolineaceae bacterium]